MAEHLYHIAATQCMGGDATYHIRVSKVGRTNPTILGPTKRGGDVLT